MNCNIVAFSWTGNTAACATALAKHLEIKAYLLVEEKERESGRVFALGGMQAMLGMKVKLRSIPDVRHLDVLIVGMPLWAGTTPPAINMFLKNAKLKQGTPVYAFVTQQSSEPPAKLEKKLRKRVAALGGQFGQLFTLSVPSKKPLSVEEAFSHTKSWADKIILDMSE